MSAAAEELSIDGVRVRCRRAGRGPAVFLLHGMGASLYSFRHQLEALASRFSVFAFDWPGYGRSEQPAGFDYSPAGYSRFLLAALDRLGLSKAHLVGNSMGGLVSLWTALHAPERVDRLVLIGTPVYPEDKPYLLWPLRWPVIGDLYARVLGPWAVPIVARSCFIDRSAITPEMLEEYSEAFRTPGGARAVRTFLKRAVPPDPAAYFNRYRELPQPTLVLRGAHDGVVHAASCERFAREHRRAKLVTLAGLGHAPHEEGPAAVNPLLLEFLAAP